MVKGVSGIRYTFKLNKNAAAVTGIEAQAKPGGTDEFALTFTGYVTCAANDVLTVYGESDNVASQNITMVDCQLVVVRIA
jgi:hypothetical protein